MKKLVLPLLIFMIMGIPTLAFADVRSERNQPDAEAIKNYLFTKKGKHEITPTFSMSTNDAFYQNYYIGFSYNYHVSNWLSAGLLLSGSFPQESSLTKTLQRPPQQGGFNVTPDVQTPLIFSTAAAELRLAPIYGKLNFFSEAVVHFDFYFLLTAGVFLTNPPPVSEPKGKVKIHPFAGVGAGQRYFLLQWLALRWEFTAHFMNETFVNRGNESRLRINMAINFGFSFFF